LIERAALAYVRRAFAADPGEWMSRTEERDSFEETPARRPAHVVDLVAVAARMLRHAHTTIAVSR
jgi:hypothetical protein